MTMFLLLLARMLTANGIPAAVCGDELVIGARCPAKAPASPPPASPPAPTKTAHAEQRPIELSPNSISNGF